VIRGAAVASLLLCSVSAAAANPLTPAQYERIVAQAAKQLDHAANRGSSGKADAIRALRQLPARADVRAESGVPLLRVDNRALLRRLGSEVRSGPGGIQAAARTLRSLEDGLRSQGPPPPAVAQRVLREVLSRREFRETWWERLQRRVAAWVMNLIASLLSHLPKVGGAGVWLMVVLWLALAAAGVIVLAAAISLLRRPRRRVRRDRRAEPVAPVRLSHLDWLAEAARAAEAGDHRAAVRAVHMAALAKLDEVGVVSFDRAATDARYVGLLLEKGRGELAAVLARLNRLFAVVWYGSAPARGAEYAAAQEGWRELEVLAAT
jgi:hypothetical protein